MSEPRYSQDVPVDAYTLCLDCGSIVADQAAHTRLHSILGGHAWALAVLKTSHIAAHVHDKYEAYDKIGSKRFDSWSSDALAEVTGAQSELAKLAEETGASSLAELGRGSLFDDQGRPKVR